MPAAAPRLGLLSGPAPARGPSRPATDHAPSSGCSSASPQGVPHLLLVGFWLLSGPQALNFSVPRVFYAPSADRGSGRSGRMPQTAPPHACRGRGRDAVGHGFLSRTPDVRMGKLRPGEFLFMFFNFLDDMSIEVSISWGTYCSDRYIMYSVGAGRIKWLIQSVLEQYLLRC